MRYQGRDLDILSLWGEYVDLPGDLTDPLPPYLTKVKCPNPAHDSHKRHFQICTIKPLVHCFVPDCGISGTYEHAIATILGFYDKFNETEARKQARRLILKQTRVAMKSAEISAYRGTGTRKSYEADSELAKDERALSGGRFQYLPREIRNYLDTRGIDDASRGKWQIGYDEEQERITIPAFDHRGTFRFMIRREVAGKSSLKYLYTAGAIKTSILFGACYVDQKRVVSQGLVLCEGPLDVIRLHQLGITNAVAILGSGLSRKQVRLIDKFGPKRVYLFFDKDLAGVQNIFDARGKLVKQPLSVCLLPKHRSDPAEMTGSEVERSMERALPMHEFMRRTRRSSTKEAA